MKSSSFILIFIKHVKNKVLWKRKSAIEQIGTDVLSMAGVSFCNGPTSKIRPHCLLLPTNTTTVCELCIFPFSPKFSSSTVHTAATMCGNFIMFYLLTWKPNSTLLLENWVSVRLWWCDLTQMNTGLCTM